MGRATKNKDNIKSGVLYATFLKKNPQKIEQKNTNNFLLRITYDNQDQKISIEKMDIPNPFNTSKVIYNIENKYCHLANEAEDLNTMLLKLNCFCVYQETEEVETRKVMYFTVEDQEFESTIPSIKTVYL
jgi:hypothetical protein